jgi:hypothetical protein
MIKNISFNNKDAKDEINSVVGDSYSWFDRIKMGGNGSPRFKVILASEKIKKLLGSNRANYYCTIELRPKGIIVNFGTKHKSYAWVIPYHQLSLYKSGDSYSFYGRKEFIRIKKNHKDSINQAFIERLIEIRTSHFQQLALMN